MDSAQAALLSFQSVPFCLFPSAGTFAQPPGEPQRAAQNGSTIGTEPPGSTGHGTAPGPRGSAAAGPSGPAGTAGRRRARGGGGSLSLERAASAAGPALRPAGSGRVRARRRGNPLPARPGRQQRPERGGAAAAAPPQALPQLPVVALLLEAAPARLRHGPATHPHRRCAGANGRMRGLAGRGLRGRGLPRCSGLKGSGAAPRAPALPGWSLRKKPGACGLLNTVVFSRPAPLKRRGCLRAPGRARLTRPRCAGGTVGYLRLRCGAAGFAPWLRQ